MREQLRTDGRRGGGEGQGKGDPLTHVLVKTLHSFYCAAAMLMSCNVNHGDITLISARAVTQ